MTIGLRRFRISNLIRTFLAAGTAVALTLTMTGSALADPATSNSNPQRQLAALQHRVEQATELYDSAREELKASQVRAAAVLKAMAAQEKKVQALQVQVNELAAAAYRGGNLSAFNSLFSADGAQNLLDELSTLQSLSKSQRAQIRDLAAAQRQLNAQRNAVATEISVQSRREATLKAKKSAIEADLRKAKSISAAAANMAERASRSAPRRSYQAFPVLPVTGSGRGAIALRFAYAQMGKPYGWGASGPGSYDCSGLTMASWRAAGVSLPHSSRMQSQSSPRVSRSQLQPGDLVFFGSPVSHVGIFVSGNTIIGAPTFGDVVRYQSISSMSYATATRPG
ncbi:MAG: NlpC/P60 family protein [Mycobacteriales bacterium]